MAATSPASPGSGGGGGGGGAVTAAAGSYADGALITEGTKADAAYAGSGSASIVAILKGVYAALVAALPAGTNQIGLVGQKLTTPTAATATAVSNGGTATTIYAGSWQTLFVQNPLTAGDQNIAAAEALYVNAVTTATANGRGSNILLNPGDSFLFGAATGTLSMIAATTAHAVSVEVFV